MKNRFGCPLKFGVKFFPMHQVIGLAIGFLYDDEYSLRVTVLYWNMRIGWTNPHY